MHRLIPTQLELWTTIPSTVKTDIGAFQAGLVDIGTGGKLDQIGSQIFDGGKHAQGANLIYSNKVNDNISVKAAYDYEAKDMGLNVDYATDQFGAELAYGQSGVTGSNASYGLNGWYNLSKDAVVYGQYAIKSTDPKQDALLAVGAKYNTGSGFWGEAEYGQLNTKDTDTMVEAGYYIQPNANIFIRNRKQTTSAVPDGTTYAILAVTF